MDADRVLKSELLERRAVQITTPIVMLARLGGDFAMGVLVLLYAGIDAMAWLSIPEAREDVRSADFMTWCDRYLLPGTDLRCSSEDLYAARCGLLHTFSGEARKIRTGQAKLLCYTYGTEPASALQEKLDFVAKGTGKADAIAVHIDSLVRAFLKGVERFDVALAENSEALRVAENRIRQQYGELPEEAIRLWRDYKGLLGDAD
jgi:hypothetical protein